MHIYHLPRVSVEEAAKKAAKELEKGSVILYPTDTVYGLGVDALNVEAVNRLHALKGRPPTWPLLIIVPDIESIEKYAVLSDTARAYAEKFLPGPLTLVLPAKDTIPVELTLNGTIGIRIPNNPFCLQLAREFGRPFTTTSANRNRRETPKTVHSVIEQFGHDSHDIEVAVDGGELTAERPSSIVSFATDPPHMVREGVISRIDLGFKP